MNADFAIIGGGPAGSACAIILARAGHSVALFERAAFPRMKVCGEYVSPAVTDVLDGLLGPDWTRASAAAPIRELRLFANAREITTWAMPASAWSLGREALDGVLLDAAREAGAIIHQPVAVRSVAYHSTHVDVCTDEGQWAVGAAIHADGTGRHDLNPPTPNRPGVVAVKTRTHLRRPLDGVLELHGVRTAHGLGYFGLSTTQAGDATFAGVFDRALVRRCSGNLDHLLHTLPADSAPIRTGDWHACGLPRSGYITSGHVRSFRVGNAAAAIEPIGGEGIGLGLWSGVKLGELLRDSPASMADAMALRAVHRRYARAYRARLRWRRPVCACAAAALRRADSVGPLLSLAGMSAPSWLGPLFRLTGKPVTMPSRSDAASGRLRST